MSVIRVELNSVRVTDGQGIGEGDFELRIEVKETIAIIGNVTKVIWPSLGTTEKVNNSGTVEPIGLEVERYTVNSGSIIRNFLIIVDEDDTGANGQDEVGQQSVSFVLTPTMSRTTRSAFITLSNNGNNEGQVRVDLVAEQV